MATFHMNTRGEVMHGVLVPMMGQRVVGPPKWAHAWVTVGPHSDTVHLAAADGSTSLSWPDLVATVDRVGFFADGNDDCLFWVYVGRPGRHAEAGDTVTLNDLDVLA